MKNKNSVSFGKLNLIVSAAAVLLSFVLAILDGVLGLKITSHPILTFLFVSVACVGIIFTVHGFMKKYTFTAFIGEILVTVALLYAMIDVFGAKWWITVIVVIAAIAVFALSSVAYFGNKANVSDDDNAEYKNYKERQAEKDAAVKEKDESEEIPEIKTFKN